MLKSLFESVLKVGAENERPEVIEIEGRKYLTKSAHEVLAPMPETLRVSTLTALVNYLTDNRDNLELENLVVHVDGPTKVAVRDKLTDDFLQRPNYVTAAPLLPSYVFDQWISTDEFITNLQAQFGEGGDREAMLKIVAGVRVESSTDIIDDGVTQHVNARAGVARVQQVELPNPCKLYPYSTFHEIDQPERQFVFRMSQSERGVVCRLIDADGGAWKQGVAIAIRKYLQTNLPEGVSVIA